MCTSSLAGGIAVLRISVATNSADKTATTDYGLRGMALACLLESANSANDIERCFDFVVDVGSGSDCLCL